jgi:hypothetical protein
VRVEKENNMEADSIPEPWVFTLGLRKERDEFKFLGQGIQKDVQDAPGCRRVGAFSLERKGLVKAMRGVFQLQEILDEASDAFP